MHSLDPNKDNEAFQKEFERILSDAGKGWADFTGFVFPASDYSATTYSVPFPQAKGRDFAASCCFNRTTFLQNANFALARFAQDAHFCSVRFNQNANFAGATFGRDALFGDTTFGSSPLWQDTGPAAESHEYANFAGATFARIAAFRHATFVKNGLFTKASFIQNADFASANFYANADFESASFLQDADFTFSRFAWDANFSSAKFYGAARWEIGNFGTAWSPPRISFVDAKFMQPEAAVFFNTYLASALFHRCDVSRIRFSTVQWHKRPRNGMSMIFDEVAPFDTKRVHGKDCPKHCFAYRPNDYKGNWKLSIEAPDADTRWEKARIKKTIKLWSSTYMPDKAEKDKAEKEKARERIKAAASKHGVEVSENSFAPAVARITARADPEDGVIDPQKLLRPPFPDPNPRNYLGIAETYQQLKRNYDNKADYWTAGDFHYGEMEMKRLHSNSHNKWVRWLHSNVGMTAWYKYVSDYGQNYVLPALWLTVILCLFTLIYPSVGLDYQCKDVGSSDTKLSYLHPARPCDDPSGWNRIKLVGHSFMTAVSVAAFDKEPVYKPHYPMGRLFAFAELLLTSTVVALFLLAVRRQFRR